MKTAKIINLPSRKTKPKTFVLSAYAGGEASFARQQSQYSRECEWEDRVPPIKSGARVWSERIGGMIVGAALAYAGFIILVVEG